MSAAVRLLFAVPALVLLAGGLWLLSRGAGGRPSPSFPSVDGGAFPRTVELPTGGTFEVPAPPRRVLLANASAVDLVTTLIGPERLAAVPKQALRYSRLADEPGDFAAVPTFVRFEAEVVLAFEPDLVICDPWAAVETVARLRELDVAVLTLPQVSRIDDIATSLRVLGDVLGVEARAEEVIADLERRIARLAERAADRSAYRALSYSNTGTGGWAAGEGTTHHELITLAGLHNAGAGRRDYVRLSFEDLIAHDPDFIVVGDIGSGVETTSALLRTEPSLAGLRAVREDRILRVPARLISSSSQEIVTGAEFLADAIDRWLAEHEPRRERQHEGD